jgi:hypothetical protein
MDRQPKKELQIFTQQMEGFGWTTAGFNTDGRRLFWSGFAGSWTRST